MHPKINEFKGPITGTTFLLEAKHQTDPKPPKPPIIPTISCGKPALIINMGANTSFPCCIIARVNCGNKTIKKGNNQFFISKNLTLTWIL